MTEEEFKKYVNRMNENIGNLLKDNDEELAFYFQLVARFNDVCDEKKKQKEAIRETKSYIREHNNDGLTLNNSEVQSLVEILDQRCKYCKEHNGDNLIDWGYDRNDDYYSCELMNALDNEKYKCYIPIENEVYEGNCKHYLCEKCEFKEKFEEYGLEHMDELIKKI
jgi:hypothetical protein